jgi:hypothetical protein
MQDFNDLERLNDRELRRLPRPLAPRTLLPRVMHAALARGPAERVASSLTASDGWRVSAAVALALLVVIGAGTLVIGSSLGGGRPLAVLQTVQGISVLMRVTWQALLQPIVTYAAVLFLLLAFASSALWLAFRYVAFEGVSHS